MVVKIAKKVRLIILSLFTKYFETVSNFEPTVVPQYCGYKGTIVSDSVPFSNEAIQDILNER